MPSHPAVALGLSALLVLAPTIVAAAQGDPRLLKGTIEWTAAPGDSPFIVMRGDDGRVYAVDVTGVPHRALGSLAPGARTTVVGIKGARAHEVTALVIGADDAAALARAITQGLATTAAAPAAPATSVPAAPATPAPTTPTASTPTTPTASTPNTPATSAPAAQAASPALASPPAPTPSSTPAPSPPAPAPPATIGSAPSGALAIPAVATSPAATTFASPDTRWIEVRGVVHGTVGRMLILKRDNGEPLLVEGAAPGSNLAPLVKPGAAVTVYGHPGEQSFRAIGIVEGERGAR